ncbi:MAG: aminotransferase class V-fold PLP-dependent enzyme [Actinobacteria bacterium]|nr:aminotransferase class V-fold PLP-dependent enzyme [Actinomycetota bacterium]
MDLEFVRDQFPAFARTDGAFFENAGGSFPCRQAIDLLTRYYEDTKVQPNHPYPLAQRAGEAMGAGSARLAAWLGVAVEDVHVGPSTSQNTYVLAHAFAEVLDDDAAVVVTQQDHEANSGPWRRLAERGVEVREWEVEPGSGALEVERLTELLDERVAVVAFPHVSNILGQRNDVATICERVHDVGAVAVVDGVAAAPHGLPDVAALGADVYLFSTYKTYGPHQGVMVTGRHLVERLPNQGHFFNADQIGKRLVPAGPDHAQIAALAGIADYLELLHQHHFGDDGGGGRADPRTRTTRITELWHDHEQQLLEPLLAFLRDRDDVRIVGSTDAAGRVPTVSIDTAHGGVELATALARHGVWCGGGHFYAYRLVEAVGVDPAKGLTRFSFVHNTSADEVERLIGALERTL